MNKVLNKFVFFAAVLWGSVAFGQNSPPNLPNLSVGVSPTAGSQYAITPVVSTAAESSHILKSTQGNLYSLYVTPGGAGYLMTFNAPSVPSDGPITAASNMVECVLAPANITTSLTFESGPMDFYSNGIVAVFSTTGCFTKTTSTTVFFKGRVQ